MIREKDGIHFDLEKKVVADSRNSTGDINFVSHAHMDHVHRKQVSNIVCSQTTAELASARLGEEVNYSNTHEKVELIPAGHIIGSRAALIRDKKKILYTGDFSTRDRTYIDGFQPVDADILVMETTYGIPAYSFPEQEEIEKQIVDWIKDTDKPLFLFVYSLGKAQKIQHLVREATDRPVVAHGSVKKMNEAINRATEHSFDSVPYSENKNLLENDGILIAPTSFSRNDALNKLVEKVDGVKAGFSGWGATEAYKHRGGYDRVFPFSDHCGFDELVETVKQVDPEKIYTTHGFDEAFASYLKRELGYDARALKQNQSSLTDF